MDKVTSDAKELYGMFSEKMTQGANAIGDTFSSLVNSPSKTETKSTDNKSKKHIVDNEKPPEIVTKAGTKLNQQNQQQVLVTTPKLVNDFDLAYVQERDEEIKKIHKDMIEVNQIYKNIAELVDSQTPLIDSIESNITSTKDNVEEANKELKEAEQTQSNNNGLMIFGVSAATIATVVGTVLVIVLL